MRTATSKALPFCLTTCDGCGHCGAGVPPTKRACFDASDAWVDALLRGKEQRRAASDAAARGVVEA